METNKYSGCLMIGLSNPFWEKIQQDISIKPNVKELEPDCHVTLLYGINRDIIKNALSSIKDKITPGEIIRSSSYPTYFNNEKESILKFDVIENTKLSILNKYLKDNFDYESKYNEYHPHITIAYLEPNSTANIIFPYTRFVVNSIIWSYKDDNGSKQGEKILL